MQFRGNSNIGPKLNNTQQKIKKTKQITIKSNHRLKYIWYFTRKSDPMKQKYQYIINTYTKKWYNQE